MTQSGDLFDDEADVLVVGSGAAGTAAAVTAATHGLSVVVFEREAVVGGTTAVGGGTVWIPNNSSLRELGIDDARDDALRYLARTSYPQDYTPGHPTLGLRQDKYDLLAAFYDRASEAIDHLSAAKALSVLAEIEPSNEWSIPYPDYSAHLPEDKTPEGRHMHPPGWYDVESIIEQMHRGAANLGVQFKVEHIVSGVLTNDDGAVFGLEIRVGRRTVIARARKAVVFGSGGFAHNVDYVREHLPGRVFGTCAAPGAVGDFVRIGQRLGARFGNMQHAWWKQVPVEPALRSSHPPEVFMPFGDAMVMVNKYGRRVVNEKAAYNERGQVHHQYDVTGRDYPNQLLFMIWDDTVAQDRGDWMFHDAVPLPGDSPDHVVNGDTLADLAAGIDERLQTIVDDTGNVRLATDFVAMLEATIERFNGFAQRGVDEDFNRGESPIEQAWTAPKRPGSPNAAMAPISPRGPYYCVILGASTLDTNGGPAINTRAQVLDAAGDPIPGLYGAGNCIASPAGQGYWGPGATIGLAITFGYIAGTNAATEPDKALSF